MTYRTGQKYFFDFITLYPHFRNTHGSVLPETKITTIEWVTCIEEIKSLQPKTIKSYVMHLCSSHVNADLPFSTCESQMLQRIIRGIKRYMGE